VWEGVEYDGRSCCFKALSCNCCCPYASDTCEPGSGPFWLSSDGTLFVLSYDGCCCRATADGGISVSLSLRQIVSPPPGCQ
jgi:hypothetical protein